MATSRVSTTLKQAEKEMYPWRRAANMSAEPANCTPDSKLDSKALSKQAKEFVPRWARPESCMDVQQPCVDVQQPIVAMQQPQFHDGNCYCMNLDAFSDDDDEEDSVQPKLTAATTTAKTTPTTTDPVAALQAALQLAASFAEPEDEPTTAAKDAQDAEEPTTKVERPAAATRRPWQRSPVAKSADQATEETTPAKPTKTTEGSAYVPAWKRAPLKKKVEEAVADTKPSQAAKKLPPWKRTAWKVPTDVDEGDSTEVPSDAPPLQKTQVAESSSDEGDCSAKENEFGADTKLLQSQHSVETTACDSDVATIEVSAADEPIDDVPTTAGKDNAMQALQAALQAAQLYSEESIAAEDSAAQEAVDDVPSTAGKGNAMQALQAALQAAQVYSEDKDEEHEQSASGTEAEPEAEETISVGRASNCDPEEVTPEVAVFNVADMLKWRTAVRKNEVASHVVPGRLTAWADPTSEVRTQADSAPKSLSSGKAKRPSSIERSWRREVVKQPQREDSHRSRDEAPAPAEKKQLQVSENSWAAKMRARRGRQADSPDERSDEEVVRAMKSILNKLTIEKFPQLYQQMISCGIRTADHLEALIIEVFEKATTQHHFIDMYADLCAQLHAHFVKNPIIDDASMSFKKILLNACQASFEKNLSPPTGLESMDAEERTEAEFAYKMRMIGNIRFVGALLVRKMLASKVMLAIIEELLAEPTPEALETLAALLTVVGADFDTPTFTHRVALNAIFAQVQGIVKKSKTPARVRCLLKDVLDLRASGWQDRRPKKMEKPTTIDEVHQKAVTEDGSLAGATTKAKPEAGEWATVPQKSGVARSASGAASPCKSSMPRKVERSISEKTKVAPVEAAPKAAEKSFDRSACHAEVLLALRELFVSHDVEEAVARVADIGIPAPHQAAELVDMLALMSEEGSAENRQVGFACVSKLILGRHWKRAALKEGLKTFIDDICADLKFDVPALPQILREELHPALEPLMEAGRLKANELEALITFEF